MDPASLSIKELKALLTSAGISYEGVFEKSELIELAKRALRNGTKADGSSPDATTRKSPLLLLPSTMCGLRCHVSSVILERVERVVIMLHGLGANERQFDFFFNHPGWNSDGRTVWVSPKSPAEGWFPINLEEFQMAMMQGRLGDKLNETSPHLREARETLVRLVREVQSRLRLDSLRRVVLGGFSQGAILAMDVALHLDENVGGVLFFSGFPVALAEWTSRMPKHQGMTVLMSHGKLDFLLPIFGAFNLSEALRGHGLEVKFIQHDGGHDLGDARAVEEARKFYVERIEGCEGG